VLGVTDEIIRVGMAETCLVTRPGAILVSYGLGSCIGIALFDPVARVGGMAHIMLPTAGSARPPHNRAKYADSAVSDLVARMERAGADRRRIVAKIAGGAQMFSAAGLHGAGEHPILSSGKSIGRRNAEAVRNVLAELEIRVTGADIGGDYGRTLKLDTADGGVTVSSLKLGERSL
jgi:chemotaxis protein CheD